MTNHDAGDRELRPAGRYEWEQIIRRARLGGLVQGSDRIGKSGRKTRGGMAGTLVKAIALGFATYASDKGREIWPGDATIAVDLETSVASVETVRKLLLRLGLMQRVRAPWSDRGTEYRLTLPSDLLDVLDVPTPAQHKLAADRLREGRRGKQSGGSAGTTSPVDPPVPPSPHADARVDPPDTPDVIMDGGSGGPTQSTNGGSGGCAPVDPADTHTDHDRTTTTTDHPVEDLRTDVAVDGAPPPDDEDRESWDGDTASPATVETPVDDYCSVPDHRKAKMRAGVDGQGMPACPLCRAAVRDRGVPVWLQEPDRAGRHRAVGGQLVPAQASPGPGVTSLAAYRRARARTA